MFGFTINEEASLSGKFRVLATAFLSDGTSAWTGGSQSASGSAAGSSWLTLDMGTPYFFVTAWDPSVGNGQYTVEFFDNTNPNAPASMGVITASMSAGIRNSAAFASTSLDAFGLRKIFAVIDGNANNSAVMFFDNVHYTTVPEPMAGGTLVAGLIALGARGRRRSALFTV